MEPQPEYDSYRDYFETHNSSMNDEGKPDCDECMEFAPLDDL